MTAMSLAEDKLLFFEISGKNRFASEWREEKTKATSRKQSSDA
jgi:hypothetical protein